MSNEMTVNFIYENGVHWNQVRDNVPRQGEYVRGTKSAPHDLYKVVAVVHYSTFIDVILKPVTNLGRWGLNKQIGGSAKM